MMSTLPRLRPGRGQRPRVPKALIAGVVAGLALALASTGLTPLAAHAARPGAGFDIPSAATTRPLGDIATGTCPQGFLPYACKQDSPGWPYPGITFPMTEPGMGVPLGGIGAGSFMVNQSGTFGPWFFGGSQDKAWESRALPQAAFHVREQIGNAPAEVRTLATVGSHAVDYKGDALAQRSWDDPLSGWNTLSKGDADYSALYPFGWMKYKPFKTNVSMRFYSPIVARDEKQSSLPVANFDIRIANTTGKTAKVSTMFTMPNVAAHQGTQPATVREGLSSQYKQDARTGVHAVTLSADSAKNTPDAEKSEWTLAAKVGTDETFSYTTSWNAAGNGSDVYAPFSATGTLGDRPIDKSSSAGAIAVAATLKPGEVKTIPFTLTWDFPQVAFANNQTVWMRHYTNYYGARETRTNDYIAGSYPFHQSYTIARDALMNREKTLKKVLDWWEPLVNSRTLPDTIKEGALNQLANVTFHTSLWEGGLVRNSAPQSTAQRAGAQVPGTHSYLGLDANSGGLSTLGQGGEIGIYSYVVYSELFPFIERDRMENKAEAILSPTSHGDPADFSVNEANGDNPFIKWDEGTDSGPGLSWFLDRPSESIFRMYDYAERNHDQKALRFAYPAMKKTFAYLQKTIPADHALPEVPSAKHPAPGLLSPQAMSNAYNGIPSNRFDSYVSSLYILATEAMIDAGKQSGEDPTILAGWKSDLSAAKSDFEKLFWNESAGYYRYTLPERDGAGGDDALIATFLAQYLAERANLPDVVDQTHYRDHLRTVARLASGLKDSQGRPVGANLLVSPSGSSGSVWPQANYAFAANLVSAGERYGDSSLRSAGLGFASAVSSQLWDVPEHGYEFNTPISYEASDTGSFLYPGWEGNLAVWEVVDVLAWRHHTNR